MISGFSEITRFTVLGYYLAGVGLGVALMTSIVHKLWFGTILMLCVVGTLAAFIVTFNPIAGGG